jgi:hypothetical protein
MENISSNTLNKKSPYEFLIGEKSRLYLKLVEFGRIGQVPLRKKVSGKWKEKVIQSHHGRVCKEPLCRHI